MIVDDHSENVLFVTMGYGFVSYLCISLLPIVFVPYSIEDNRLFKINNRMVNVIVFVEVYDSYPSYDHVFIVVCVVRYIVMVVYDAYRNDILIATIFVLRFFSLRELTLLSKHGNCRVVTLISRSDSSDVLPLVNGNRSVVDSIFEVLVKVVVYDDEDWVSHSVVNDCRISCWKNRCCVFLIMVI